MYDRRTACAASWPRPPSAGAAALWTSPQDRRCGICLEVWCLLEGVVHAGCGNCWKVWYRLEGVVPAGRCGACWKVWCLLVMSWMRLEFSLMSLPNCRRMDAVNVWSSQLMEKILWVWVTWPHLPAASLGKTLPW
jgi:hypothetical protein